MNRKNIILELNILFVYQTHKNRDKNDREFLVFEDINQANIRFL
jgi:hypothetical protein